MEREITIHINHAIRIMKAKLYIDAKMDALDKLLGEAFSEYVGRELEQIQDTVLDMLGVAEEGTPFSEEEKSRIVKEFSQQGASLVAVKSSVDYGFCRDNINDVFYCLAEEIDPQKDGDSDDAIDDELIREIYFLAGRVEKC